MVKASRGAIGTIVAISVSSSDDVEDDLELLDFREVNLVANCILLFEEYVVCKSNEFRRWGILLMGIFSIRTLNGRNSQGMRWRVMCAFA